jgi:antitoxin VapB
MNTAERRVRLFRDGTHQALCIPQEMEFQGDEALVHKEGDSLIVTPVRRGRLLELLDSWEPLDESLPEIDSELGMLDDADL